MKKFGVLSPRQARRVDVHLEAAAAYLSDGARTSALCHIAAAQRVLRGRSVPRGPEFWTLISDLERLGTT